MHTPLCLLDGEQVSEAPTVIVHGSILFLDPKHRGLQAHLGLGGQAPEGCWNGLGWDIPDSAKASLREEVMTGETLS